MAGAWPVAGARSLRSFCALRLLESVVRLKTPETGRFDNTALLRLGAPSARNCARI
jgi:hypothetical protein